MTGLLKLLKDKRGVSALEYAMVASLISVAGISAMRALGGQSDTGWQGILRTTTNFLGY
jgi:Flp pilus assembly pilin Flp